MGGGDYNRPHLRKAAENVTRGVQDGSLKLDRGQLIHALLREMEEKDARGQHRSAGDSEIFAMGATFMDPHEGCSSSSRNPRKRKDDDDEQDGTSSNHQPGGARKKGSGADKTHQDPPPRRTSQAAGRRRHKTASTASPNVQGQWHRSRNSSSWTVRKIQERI